MKHCGYCGRQIDENVKFCPYCGRQPGQATPGQAASAAKKYCGKCGRAMPATARFCPYCGGLAGAAEAGSKRPEKPARPGKAPRPPKKRRWIVAVAAALVVCIGVGGFLAYSRGMLDRLFNPSAKYHTEENGYVSDGKEMTYASPTDESHLKPVVEGNDDLRYADNELIVQLANPTTEAEARRIARENGAELVGFISVSGTCQWRLKKGHTYDELRAMCSKIEAVQDYASATPNEYSFSEENYDAITSKVLPDDAVFYNNCYYYAFPAEGMSKREAEQRCKDLGGTIAQIRNDENLHFLLNYTREQGYDAVNLLKDSQINTYSNDPSTGESALAYVCQWSGKESTMIGAVREAYNFTDGTAEFHYSAGDGTIKQHYFYYNDFMFYSFDEVYRYQPLIAQASLCMAMAGFSSNNALAWNQTLDENDTRRASNILELYRKIGFKKAECHNYNVPLTDTTDKVAYSFAYKYIDDDEGGFDTLVAVVIRGGQYGGEWGSNFHVTDGSKKNHIGFQSASNGVLSSLKGYVDDIKIKGKLKLWITGYSRSAAVANLLAHSINENGLGKTAISHKDTYTYTFATPAGALAGDVLLSSDPNIFNIVSPVDLVPKVAPKLWGFGRYGTTLILPYDNDNLSLWSRFQELSGLTHEARTRIYPLQRKTIEAVINKLSDDMSLKQFSAIQTNVMSIIGNKLGSEPKSDSNTIKALVESLNTISTLKDCLALLVSDVFGGICTAHRAEYYLARLETDSVDKMQGELESTEAPRTKPTEMRETTTSAPTSKTKNPPKPTTTPTPEPKKTPNPTKKPDSGKVDYAAIFRAKMDELVKQYGAMAGEPQVKTVGREYNWAPIWTSHESEGMLFGDVFDYDSDGAPELLTMRNAPGQGDSNFFDLLFLEIYEVKDGACVLSDTANISAQGLSMGGWAGTGVSAFRYSLNGAPAIGVLCETDSGMDWVVATLSYGYTGKFLLMNNGVKYGSWPGAYAEEGEEGGYLSACFEAVSERSALYTSANGDAFEHWKVVANSGHNFYDAQVNDMYWKCLGKIGLTPRRGGALSNRLLQEGPFQEQPVNDYIRYHSAGDSLEALEGDLTTLGNITNEYFIESDIYFARDYFYQDMQEFIAAGNLATGRFNRQAQPSQPTLVPVELPPVPHFDTDTAAPTQKPKASADDSEKALRKKVLAAYSGSGDIQGFGYSDFDWDGRHEAFALIGVYNDSTWENTCELWFVSPDTCMRLEKDKGYYPGNDIVTEGGYACYVVNEGYFGSGSKTRLWTVLDGQPVLYSQSEFAGQSGEISREVYLKPRDSGGNADSDDTGHGGTVKVREAGLRSNVRTGPGLDYDTLGELSGGMELEFLNETSIDGRGVTWYKVRFEGREGWVSEKYTKLKTH